MSLLLTLAGTPKLGGITDFIKRQWRKIKTPNFLRPSKYKEALSKAIDPDFYIRQGKALMNDPLDTIVDYATNIAGNITGTEQFVEAFDDKIKDYCYALIQQMYGAQLAEMETVPPSLKVSITATIVTAASAMFPPATPYIVTLGASYIPSLIDKVWKKAREILLKSSRTHRFNDNFLAIAPKAIELIGSNLSSVSIAPTTVNKWFNILNNRIDLGLYKESKNFVEFLWLLKEYMATEGNALLVNANERLREQRILDSQQSSLRAHRASQASGEYYTLKKKNTLPLAVGALALLKFIK